MSTNGEKIQPKRGLLFQKKPLSPEAQCIVRVLENCISQLEIAATLPAILCFNGVSGVEDKTLSKALKEHQISVEKLDQLEGAQSNREHEEEAGEARKRSRALLEKAIKNSFRDVLRFFRTHPDAIFGLTAELSMKVEESEYIVIRELKMFHSHIIEMLQASLKEEQQLVLNKQVPSPLIQTLKDIISEEEEIAAAMKQTDVKISQIDVTIKTLQSALEAVNKQLNDETPLVQKQPTKTTNVKEASIQQEIDRLNIQLNNLMLENNQAEKIPQEKNTKVEMEMEYLLQNIDDEIEENQASLDLNERGYEKEDEDMKNLEKPYSALEEDYNQVMKRRQLAEEKRRAQMKELELKTKAAIIAQAWWRGFKTRKALKSKGKRKKGKKGKSKKIK
ncbi:dynein regulatory complex protein 10 [Brachyistius frenatus]|uniref:dynein regulatory complex protein 10 n=1 Tax=Brachyistius frenatus TaxID=100188 RepID=UPI0037E85DF6